MYFGQCMLTAQPYFRDTCFLSLGRNFFIRFWDHFLVSIKICFCCFFMCYKIIKNIRELLHMLWPLCVRWAMSIRIRNGCMHWAYTSGTNVCTEHTYQELMRALSICIKYLCCTEQWSLQNILSIRIRNRCVHWAYAPGTYACTEYTRKEILRLLRKRTSN